MGSWVAGCRAWMTALLLDRVPQRDGESWTEHTANKPDCPVVEMFSLSCKTVEVAFEQGLAGSAEHQERRAVVKLVGL